MCEDEKEELIHIHWTCGSLEEARKVARILVNERLVACANIIPWIESVFLWNDQLDTQQESKVIFKTLASKFEAVKRIILENTKYEVPEIIQTPISGGNHAYLDWVRETLASTKD